MRFPWKRKAVYDGCMCDEFCSCTGDDGAMCYSCKWYRMIDSGYGNCVALPVVQVVPWCRPICSLSEVSDD